MIIFGVGCQLSEMEWPWRHDSQLYPPSPHSNSKVHCLILEKYSSHYYNCPRGTFWNFSLRSLSGLLLLNWRRLASLEECNWIEVHYHAKKSWSSAAGSRRGCGEEERREEKGGKIVHEKNILHRSVLRFFFFFCLTHQWVIRCNSGTFIQLSHGEALITSQSLTEVRTEFHPPAAALQMRNRVKKEFSIKRRSVPFDCGQVGPSALLPPEGSRCLGPARRRGGGVPLASAAGDPIVGARFWWQQVQVLIYSVSDQDKTQQVRAGVGESGSAHGSFQTLWQPL